MDYKTLVEQSIAKAESFQSRLTPEAAVVPSFTSPKIRHLLNNLGSAPGLHYLEVGVHKGGTFMAANVANQLSSSYAIDNWSEFPEGGESRRQFLANAAKILRPGSYKFYEADCFTLTPEQLPDPINFYLYDGNHSYESQKKALTYFYPLLADEFILLVDDYNWPDVHRGTKDGIVESNLEVVYERALVEGWWNGMYVAVLRKKDAST